MSGKVKIVTFVPTTAADAVRQALGEAGAGKIGKYHFCSYSISGYGRFLPINGANPTSGKVGELSVEPEERIEVVCNRADAKRVVAAMKQAHPYEEVAYDIYESLDEDEL
ncbi:MAG: hypothetical protein WAQ25_02300 [Candidatus Saccharimonas sp.]